ncbi:IS5 family transposase [Frigidibacter sp. ROC022]|uniref:IS5 family transposase n=1 Tax=Frigidibacter sp. ROC022 TaxID=2971796 RepID=UPI00215AB689|nr:IS5 family transposase [Frigidibacter sp. ROC022]MCR8724689.1 IS5 family transposase [Frigidibacter sp. ROC022]
MEISLARDLMSDKEWAFFVRFILTARTPNGRKPANHCLVLDGVFWIARTGAPCRDLPEEFGKWLSVYRQFRCWMLAGLREEIMDALNQSGAVPHALQMIDSSVIRAHYQAAGAKRGTPRQGFGRSRGGFTTKIHLLVNAHGLPMRTEITPGQTSDHLGFDLVMADNLPSPSVQLADRGYDTDSIRAKMEKRDVLPVIPMRKSRKKRIGMDRSLCRLRNLVERRFNKLKNARRVATRYHKTAESFLGFVDITSIRLWRCHFST